MNRYPGNSSPWANCGQFRPQLQGRGPNFSGGGSPGGPRFPYYNTPGSGHENFANGSPRAPFYPSPRQRTPNPQQFSHNQSFSSSGGPYGSGPQSGGGGFRPNLCFGGDGLVYGSMTSTPQHVSSFGNDSRGRGGQNRKRPSPSGDDGPNANKSFRSHNNSSFGDDITKYFHPSMLQDPWAQFRPRTAAGSQTIST